MLTIFMSKILGIPLYKVEIVCMVVKEYQHHMSLNTLLCDSVIAETQETKENLLKKVKKAEYHDSIINTQEDCPGKVNMGHTVKPH